MLTLAWRRAPFCYPDGAARTPRLRGGGVQRSSSSAPQHDSAPQHAATLAALLLQRAGALGTQPFLQEWKSGEGITHTLSFTEFAAQVAAAAAHLAQHKVLPADRVALLAHPTASFFVHVYAVMAMGGVSALLNWRQPAETLAAMMQSSGCTVLLCSCTFELQVASICERMELKLLLWLDWPERTALAPGEAAMPALTSVDTATLAPRAALRLDGVHPDTLALIMFTSGSTSTSKPVPFTHANLLWSLEHSQQQRLRCAEPLARPGGGTLSFLPNFHVIGFINNFLSNLYAGLRCAVLQDVGSTLLTPQLLFEACVDLRPVLIDSVPVMVEGLLQRLEAGLASAEERAALADVHAVMAGGCQLNQELLVRATGPYQPRTVLS